MTELSANTLSQFMDFEDFETFYKTADRAFVQRMGRPDLIVATINIEDNYTKSHFNESVDLLISHYQDVLPSKPDVIVARVGKLASDLGEVGRRTNGKHRAEARSCIATMLLETMLDKVNQAAPKESEECLPPLVFGNADPYAKLAALAAANGDYTYPEGLDYSISKDTLIVYYIDWKKAAITAQIPENLSQVSEDTGFNHLSFIHTADHDSNEDYLDIRTIGQQGNRSNHLTNSDLFFKSTDTTWKTPLVVYLKHTEQKASRTRSIEAKRKRNQEWKKVLAARTSSSTSGGTALRATVAASVFGTAKGMGTAIAVKEFLLSPWTQFFLVAALAVSILIMMPPRRGTGRAPPKAKSSVTNYRPLEDPDDGVTQAYRADRGLIPSDGWGHIQYIEGREVYHDQYHCTERQQITAPTKFKRRCRHCFEIAKSHGAGRFVPPPPLPESTTKSPASAKLLASPKLQGPPAKSSSPAPPEEALLTPGEQVRARGSAVLTAMDPEREPEPSSSSVQRAVAQGKHNHDIDILLAELHGNRDYSAPSGTRIPSGNLQDNPDYREAFKVLLELPDREGVSLRAVQTISKGLMVSFDSVKYYEKALLTVQKDLFEGEELRSRLTKEMYEVDELSSVIKNQDEHIKSLEAARISSEQAHESWANHLKDQVSEQETMVRDLTAQLETKKEELKTLQDMFESRDRELSSEISSPVVDRNEAVLQYQFACESFSAELTAMRNEDTRVREQLREAYSQRDNYKSLADRLSIAQPTQGQVPEVDFLELKSHLETVQAEYDRNILHLEQNQAATRRYKEQLSQTRQRCIELEVQKSELETRVGYITGAISTAHQLLDKKEISQKELEVLIQEEAAWSRQQADRIRNRVAPTQTTGSAGSEHPSSNSFVLIGNSQAPPATSSTIRRELDEPDEAIQ